MRGGPPGPINKAIGKLKYRQFSDTQLPKFLASSPSTSIIEFFSKSHPAARKRLQSKNQVEFNFGEKYANSIEF